MAFKEKHSDWLFVALLLTPHAVLLTAIWVKSDGSIVSINSISDILSCLGNISTTIGLILAALAYNTWKKALSTPKRQKMEEEILDALPDVIRLLKPVANAYEETLNAIDTFIKHNHDMDIPKNLTEKMEEARYRFNSQWDEQSAIIYHLKYKANKMHPAFKVSGNTLEYLARFSEELSTMRRSYSDARTQLESKKNLPDDNKINFSNCYEGQLNNIIREMEIDIENDWKKE